MSNKIPVTFCESKEEAKALAGFLWNEKERHLDDIVEISKDLSELKRKFGVEPSKERRFVKP